jgi:hypothetical protein
MVWGSEVKVGEGSRKSNVWRKLNVSREKKMFGGTLTLRDGPGDAREGIRSVLGKVL